MRARPGSASSGCVQDLRTARTIVWGPSAVPRNLYEVGTSTNTHTNWLPYTARVVQQLVPPSPWMASTNSCPPHQSAEYVSLIVSTI